MHDSLTETFAESARRVLRCPDCGGSLDCDGLSSGDVRCGDCAGTFPLKHGVLDFAHDAGFYWGELDRDVMVELLNSERSINDYIKTSLSETDPSLADYLSQYVFDRRRAGWKYLLDLPHDGRALDFGCGWGALALSLAPHVSEMWVTDAVPERVAMVMKRAAESGLRNLQGCCSSGWPRLPFADASVDLVILNGVLEWIPLSIAGDPNAVQQAFLNEVARVVAPTGQVVVGIENRFGYSYFTGRREEHTKLRFISLLPRPLGRLYHRWIRQADYRCYTYGRYGLRRLLQTAGMNSVQFYCPYPDYRDFDRVCDPGDRQQLASSFSPVSRHGRLKAYLSERSNALAWCANSFLVVSTRTESPSGNGFLRRLLLDHGVGAAEVTPPQIIQYRLTATAFVLVRLRLSASDQDVLISLPLDARAGRRLEKVRAFRRQITLPETVAMPAAFGCFEGIPYVFESYFEGRKAIDLPGSEGEAIAWTMLTRFHRSLTMQRSQWSPMDSLPDDAVHDFMIAIGAESDFQTRLKTILESSHDLLLGPVHGDFHAGNILVNPDTDRVCVIDWDMASVTGLPAWDALTLWMHSRFERSGGWAAAFQAMYRLARNSKQESPLRHYLVNQSLTVPEIMIGFLTFPMFQWGNKMRYGDQRGQVITSNLLPVMEEIVRDMESVSCPA